MLSIASKLLPRSEYAYAAFRIAFLDTRERLALAYQLDISTEHSFGYLTEVPFLRCVPAPVQLEYLLNTWQKHQSAEEIEADMLDEAVLYAVSETAANVIRNETTTAKQFMQQGPVPFSARVNYDFADQLQKLHLGFDNPGNYLLLSQFQDMAPDEADELKQKYGIDPAACECLFDALCRWYVSPDVLDHTPGLLTENESVQVRDLLDRSICIKDD